MFLHTRLKVRDLERSIAFYSTHFGMVCRRRKTSPRGSQLAFMTMPGSPTELELAYLPWDPDFQLPEDIFHLAFRVEDMNVAIEQIRAAGVKVTEEPSGRRNGGDMAFIEDPDGYEIELLSYAPGDFELLQAEIAAVRPEIAVVRPEVLNLSEALSGPKMLSPEELNRPEALNPKVSG